MTAQRVIFAHLAGHQSSGAKIMRCDQLAVMAAGHLDPNRWTFEVMAMPRDSQLRKQRLMTKDVQGAVVIFLKRAWKVLSPEHLAGWRDAARAVAIDYVDARTTPQPGIEIDVHIAASGALERHLKRTHLTANVIRLDHHADPSLTANTTRTGLRLGYFGRETNRTLPESLAHRVHEPHYDGLAIGHDIQTEIARANMHYAVRDMDPEAERTSFKPFTKGFNAAATGAHILVNTQVDDAQDWLPADYPFLIPNCAPDTIAAAIDRAESLYGTPKWTQALSVMDDIRGQTSPARITSQLETILENLMR